tara:strand:+ start:565 stop:1818 length:1254 start_codon:yes stop_codon:yes gene_type:complete
MSGIVGSKLNTRGSGIVADLGTDGQVLTSAGAGKSISYEDAAGGGTSWQSVVTASTLTAVAGNGYPINTTSNACTVTLPASASVGDTIEFVDYARTWETNNVTINPNSLNFQGATTPQPVYSFPGGAVKIVYVDATRGWTPMGRDEIIQDKSQASYAIEWLVVAGGGSGGWGANGGGGGAGGYRESTQTLAAGVKITVVVGRGGKEAHTGENQTTGDNGDDSSITGTGLTTITSTGGGAAGGYGPPNSGGSGGGAGVSYPTAGSGNTPSTSPSQGNPGGALSGAGCGGGGGANATGGNATGNSDGGDGGAGTANDITGSSVTYAGGGGGSHDSGNATNPGGAGGGGFGTRAGKAGDGTHYLGGGGGGAGMGGAGGHGIVIARIPTDSYSGKVYGNRTAYQDGDSTVVVWHYDGWLIT